jgi:hypothetical protein
MSDRTVLLERYRRRMEEGMEQAPLDYIQLRNLEALRQWRIRRAFATELPSSSQPRPQGAGGRSGASPLHSAS